MPTADVSICIPAWQAEGFIERTLKCAIGQTHARIRILVSVDRCDDKTESICRGMARQDGRIVVFAQAEQLGWSRNANFLLERVDTEFFFFYFHDDIIEPTYTAELRQALLDCPEAKSVHCDLERFGNVSSFDPGSDYRGSDSRRLISFLVGPVKGTPLRSLTRSELLGEGLRFPLIGTGGFWRCHPYLLQLLGAGPALRVPRVLYRRWFRDGSMTGAWAPKTLDELLEGQRHSARLCLDIIERARSSDEEKDVVRFCLYLFMMTYTRQNELPLHIPQLIDPLAISPAFGDPCLPPCAGKLAAEVLRWIRQASARLVFLEAEHALLHRDHETAKLKLANALALHPKLRKARLPALLARAGVDPAAFEIPEAASSADDLYRAR